MKACSTDSAAFTSANGWTSHFIDRGVLCTNALYFNDWVMTADERTGVTLVRWYSCLKYNIL